MAKLLQDVRMKEKCVGGGVKSEKKKGSKIKGESDLFNKWMNSLNMSFSEARKIARQTQVCLDIYVENADDLFVLA